MFVFCFCFLARPFDATQFQRLIPVACAARQQCKGIITFEQGEQEPRITPATVKYCLTPGHYSKAPIIHFSALHSSPPDPLAARLLFTPHTHTHSMCRRCFLATTSPCGVYVQLCIMLVKKRIAATMKTIEYLHLLVF